MIYLLITIILFVLIMYLFFKIFSKIIHTLIAGIILFLFIMSGVILFTYYDYRDVTQNLATSPIVILLQDEEDYLAGGIYIFERDIELKEAIDVSNLGSKSYKEILGDNYKLFIVKTSFIDKNMDKDIDYKEHTLTKEQLLDSLRSDNIYTKLPEYIDETEESIKDKEPDENKLRAQLFLYSFLSIVGDEGNRIMIQGYKDKDIIVYKKTMLFRLIKLTPSFILNNKDNED